MSDWRQRFTMYYEGATLFYLIAPLIVFPTTFFIMAPFGRFSSKRSKYTLDGVLGWMVMETVAPISFLVTYFLAPFSPAGNPPPLNHTSSLLAALFLLHYLNRSIISPLRSPGRSRTHIIVVLAAIIFNLVNPSLMAAYLSAPISCPRPLETGSWQHLPKFLQPPPLTGKNNTWNCLTHTFYADREPSSIHAWTSPTFVLGIIAFVIGFASNILHDEVLYNLRRNNPPGPDGKHQYIIPRGYLYDYISFPNYLSEWIEWTGFALAASPRWEYTPPWMFVVAEVMVMLPRAYKGHQWYKEKFADYPKNRKAVIPFVL